MVNTILVQLIIFLLAPLAWGKMDRIHTEGFLGEKNLDAYSERRRPVIEHDFYLGQLGFKDQLFYQNYFAPYLFEQGPELTSFMKSELLGSLSCPNQLLSEHYDDIRYSYRLITLSYLLEGQWHMNMVSKHFAQRKGCKFDLQSWASKCHPKSQEMKKFVSQIRKYNPKYEESLPRTYIKSDWWKDFKKKNYKYYSHYRMGTACKDGCEEKELEEKLGDVCREDEELMTLICSESDELYGLSHVPDAYYLVGTSNIINTYNKHGEAYGCLRRFSQVLSHKEVRYPVLTHLFQTLRAHLQTQYQERFLQGRVFFFGSGKEFEEKGLKELYVLEQPLKIEELDKGEPEPAPAPVIVQKKVEVAPKAAKKAAPVVKKEVVEVTKPVKSAFLMASEIRKNQNLEEVEVDMLKLKYDYVFTLNMINNLSTKLRTFMSRDALMEMFNFDKLGARSAPVPLLFIKFMIDMQEHTGLYNLVSVLGDEFYVSNEIDSAFKPEPERVRLVNTEATGRKWQLYILRP